MSKLLSNISNIEINFRKNITFQYCAFEKSYNLSINNTNTFLYLFDRDCYSKNYFKISVE